MSPSSLNFGAQAVGSFGAAQIVTVLNTGNGTLDVTGLDLSGADPTDFLAEGSCGTGPVPPQGTCTVYVSFIPAEAGARSATLNITDNAAGSPQSLVLAGTAVAPGVAVSPAQLSFGSQVISTTSAAQTVTVVNNGTVPETIGDVALNGADFSAVDTCAGASLDPGAGCTVSVSFTPLAAGSRTGSISIIDDAPDSPQTITLSGIGAAVSGITGTPVTATGTMTAASALTATPTMTPGLASGAVTPTPTARPSGHAAKHRSGHHAAQARLPLAITVQQRDAGTGLLRVVARVKTAEHARVYAALKVVATTGRAPRAALRAALKTAQSNATAIPAGVSHGRASHTPAVALYIAAFQGRADRRGQFTHTSQAQYGRARLDAAYLTVTVRTAHGTATRTVRVSIQSHHGRHLYWFGVCVSQCGSSH